MVEWRAALPFAPPQCMAKLLSTMAWRPLLLTKRYLTTVGRAVGSDFQVTSTVFSASSAGTMLISFIFSDLHRKS